MDMDIVLGRDDRVDARFRGRTVVTDQDGAAPAPMDLFLASIGTCAGLYISRFCRGRGIATEGLRLHQHASRNPDTGLIERIELELTLPADFPEKYRAAVLRAAELCTVKKHLAAPPGITVTTVRPLAETG